MLRRRRDIFERRSLPFKKIGFFHFGSNQKADPIASLRTALLPLKEEDIGSSLIVMPEAFNLRGGYYGNNRQVDLRIFGWLAQMSSEVGIAFVAGVIEPSSASSVYLIDGRTQKLLSRKVEDDRSGNYQPSASNHDAVLQYRGLCLGALICMDASIPRVTASARHQRLLSEFQSAKPIPSVLCIPSCMGSYSSEAIVKAWPSEITAILSNSSASHPSVIRIGETLITIKSNEITQNLICLADIPSTPSGQADASE